MHYPAGSYFDVFTFWIVFLRRKPYVLLMTHDVLRFAPTDIPSELNQVVEYRKSGLSLNHVVGCPLDCGYCVRHMFGNFQMKRPHLICDDEKAVSQLMSNWAFQRHKTPIQIFNRATDPFLPKVKLHLHNTLEILDAHGLENQILIITRWKVTREDVERLEQLKNLRVTVLVTWSGIEDDRIEPVDSMVAEQSLATLSAYASRTKCVLYWRPIVLGLNDGDDNIVRAAKLSKHANASVFTGLFHRKEIREYLRSVGVEDLYDNIARRKIMPREVEARILSNFKGRPLFKKTSCAVAYAHGLPDWNGHYGIDHICDICPIQQIKTCATVHRRPERRVVHSLANVAGISTTDLEIGLGHITVSNSTEQQRYYMQHSLGYQVHDRKMPHLPERHGRAEEGWE